MKKDNKRKAIFGTSEVVFLVVITCVLSFAMAMLICNKGNSTSTILMQNDGEIGRFVEQYNNIVDNYYKPLDKDELIDNAIRGMVESLDDPYAAYYDEEEAKNLNIRLNGTFEGIGVEILKLSAGTMLVVNVYEDSPAAVAGIKAGDEIYYINKTSVTEITTTKFSEIVMSDKENTITVKRNNEMLDFKVTKGNVTIQSVYSEIIEDKIGYMKINIFALNTYSQVRKHLENLREQGIESLIIDLRDNSGGHLSAATDILSLFLSKQKVMYQTRTSTMIEKFYSEGTEDFRLPIVVLVNSNSASASEIVTAALKENLGAIVIGKTTVGKGTAQRLVTLTTGQQFKFTISEWLTPKGNTINGIGIKPDIEESDEGLFIARAVEYLSE